MTAPEEIEPLQEVQETSPSNDQREGRHESPGEPIQYNPGITAAVPGRKKRSKNRTTASRGPTAMSKKRGSGFEEYFADPPMTPDEALEEKMEIYSPDLPFAERIQNCIQRFRARRRLQAERTLYFNEYLFLGGVDTNPGAYTGLGRQDLRDLTPAQRRDATAKDVVYGTTSAGDRFYNGDENTWSVDFAGVAAGFFSVALIQLSSFEANKMEIGVDMVENFLRYVLHHDVCPEYEDDLKAALSVCELARVEWPMLRRFYASVPGAFNLAAAELFSPDEVQNSWSFHQWTRPEGFNAKAVFYSSLALMENGKYIDKIIAKEPKVVREFNCTLEVVEIHYPSETNVSVVKSLIIDGKKLPFPPVGKTMCKPAVIEDEWDTPELPCPITGQIALYLDQDLLQNLKSGMKMTVGLCELDIGLYFVKTLEAIVPSFHTFLPQELMRHYRAPKENDRPAPSVNDPDAEEKQFANAERDG